MKRIIAMLLAVLMLAALTACGGENPDVTQPATQSTTQDTTTQQTEATIDAADADGFYFEYEGVKLVPGAAFDPAVLPEADSVFEVPSCAIEGTDNVYSYPPFELTAYNDGTGEVIYSIYLVDPDASTMEGLYVGDDLATVTQLYGTDYTENDTELTFTKGNTTLNLILDGETVISIEYRMVV
jgi:predicted small lipoprotein YifL